MANLRLSGPVATIIVSTLSFVAPNWLRMKAGALLSLIVRTSENTASSAVTGLPEANLRPALSTKVIDSPSGAIVQLSANSPLISSGLAGFGTTRRS